MKKVLNPKKFKFKQSITLLVTMTLMLSLVSPINVGATSDIQFYEDCGTQDNEPDSNLESDNDNYDTESTSDNIINTDESEDTNEEPTDNTVEGGGDTDTPTVSGNDITLDEENNTKEEAEDIEETESIEEINNKTSTVSGNNIITQSYSTDIQSIVDLLGLDNISINEENNSITLLNDINATGYLTITEDITLDLNGFKLNIDISDTTKNFLTISSNNFTIIGGAIAVSNGDNIISVQSGATINIQDCILNQTNCSRVAFNLGTTMLKDCTIENSTSIGNGGAFFVRGGYLRLEDCTVRYNTAKGNGGAIATDSGATIEICGNTLFSGNKANNLGNAIYSNGSTIILKDNCNIDKVNIWVSSESLLDDQRVKLTTLQDLIDNTQVNGVLTIEKNYINQTSVIINKDITIDLNGHTIEGAFTNIEELITIDGANVSILNGELNQLSGTPVLYRVIYVHNNGKLSLNNVNTNANNTRFLFIENSESEINNCSLTNCGGQSTSGGAIISLGGTIIINNTIIENCQGTEGAAVRALNNSKVYIENSEFNSNKAIAYNNLALGYGGAIYCKDSELTVSGNTKFINNKASSLLNYTGKYGIGGAIYSDSEITITGDNQFSDNIAWFGGAIYCLGELNIHGGTLNNNLAKLGGAICGSDITIDGNTIISNNQATWGGGICSGPVNGWSDANIKEKGSLKLSDNVVIENNTAIRVSGLNKPSEYTWNDDIRGQGGGIWTYDLVIDGDVSIKNNYCGQFGGGIYSRHSLTMSQGSITNNEAQLGGGIFLFNEGFIQGSPLNPIHINDNYASDSEVRHGFAGGGVFVEHSVDPTAQGPYGASLHINGVVITDNTAEGLGRGWGGGGAIGGCGEAMVHAYSGQGAAIYNNHSPNTDNIMSQAQDIRLDGKGTITTQGLGRTTIVWNGVGGGLAGQESTWTPVNITSGNMEMNGMRLTATMSESDIQLAKTIAGVYMTGNRSGSSGGAIGGNGEIKLGMPVQEITAQKIWDDNNDEYGERPLTLSVTLNRKGKLVIDGKLEDVDEVIDTQVITSNDNWKYTWYDLEELDDSNLPWKYYVDEIDSTDDMKNYKKKLVGTNIYNTYTKTSFTIQKIWEDSNNIDKIRPDKIEVAIYRNNIIWDTIELSNNNNWKYTFEKVDKYDENDKEYKYTIQEKEVPEGYTVSIKDFEITNKHTPIEKTSFTVQKIWNDENNIDGIRPDTITVEVYRNNELYDTVELSKDNNWKKEYTNIPKEDLQGNKYTYTVKEVKVPEGYTHSINGMVITNTHIHIPKIDIPVNKIWDDKNNIDGLRTEKVEVELLRDGIVIDTIELSNTNNWQYTFKDLDKTDNKKHEYKYSIREKEVPDGYTSIIKDYTIINRHIPKDTPKTSFTIHKDWVDNNNQHNKRPNQIEVTVYRNGLWYDSIILSKDNNWSYTYTNVEKEDTNGNLYVYSIAELKIPDGYTSNINGYNITNTYIDKVEPEKTGFLIQKIWDDNNNKDNIRPTQIEVEVYRNNILFDTVILSELNNWRKEYTNLDAQDKLGNKYTYNIKEKTQIHGYLTVINGFIIINKHTPKEDEHPEIPKTSFKVYKIWDDEDNKDNIRPSSIEVKVLRNGLEWDTIILNENNAWSYSYIDIDKQDSNGKEYKYTIQEVNIPDGYTSEIDGFTIKNKHIPDIEKTSHELDDVPQTGDDTDLLTPFILLIISLTSIVILEIQIYRDRKKIKEIEKR